MPQEENLPKFRTLVVDSKTKEHFIVLPSCVDRPAIEGFRCLHPFFRVHKNSGSWLQQSGFTSMPGVTTKSQVIVVAHDKIEEFKTHFYEWLEGFLNTIRSAVADRNARMASA